MFIRIHQDELGLLFRNGDFAGVLRAGSHWRFQPFARERIEKVSLRAPALLHTKLDVIVKSGALGDRALTLDLQDHERALVFVDERFSHIDGPGLHVYFTTLRKVRAEIFDARTVRFEHKSLPTIARAPQAWLEIVDVEPGCAAVLFVDGRFAETLGAGRHAFWRGAATVKTVAVDLRETTQDVGGQEIMTADKVTLRLNAVVTYRVVDPRQSVTAVDDAAVALYRETQLALRAAVGGRELDALLSDKESLTSELETLVRKRAARFGVEIVAIGVRDIILPGEMKDLMNKVTEAKKAAEANLIARREETAAIRSQANTAKLLQDSPALMRLRELEVLEKIAMHSKLSVVLGEKGLADRVTNLL